MDDKTRQQHISGIVRMWAGRLREAQAARREVEDELQAVLDLNRQLHEDLDKARGELFALRQRARSTST